MTFGLLGFLSASILSITEIVEAMLETADSSDALNSKVARMQLAFSRRGTKSWPQDSAARRGMNGQVTWAP